jgi:rhodanese-related sulfurtransferase
MKRREILIMGLLLVGGVIAIFLPDTKAHEHIISKKELLYDLNRSDRYMSTDELAKAIMEGDQSYMLIDIRTPNEYKKYSIEGAVNIPFDSLMTENNKWKFDLDQNPQTPVLYSNGSSKADQAWLKLHSFDYKNVKVLKGGLNEWYMTILNPQKPADDELTGQLEEQYLFRKGAQVYFTGANPVGNGGSAKPKKASSKPIVKRKKKEVSGGCG